MIAAILIHFLFFFVGFLCGAVAVGMVAAVILAPVQLPPRGKP